MRLLEQHILLISEVCVVRWSVLAFPLLHEQLPSSCPIGLECSITPNTSGFF